MYKLTITFAQGRNLIAADKGGTSDPYVKANVKRKVTGKSITSQAFKTQVIKKTLNPTWNESTVYPDVVKEDTLSVKCFDHDRVGKHDPLGNLTISVNTLIEYVIAGTTTKWFPLEKGDKGELLLQFEFDPHPTSTASKLATNLAPPVSKSERRKSADRMKESMMATTTTGPVSSTLATAPSTRALPQVTADDPFNFTCKISNVSCRGLAVKDTCGTSDPYVKFELDSESHKTEVIYKNLNPVFEYSREFKWSSKCTDQYQLAYKNLMVSVWDKDKTDADDLIGRVSIPALNLIVGPKHHVHEAKTSSGRPEGLVSFDFEIIQDSGRKIPKITPNGIQVDTKQIIPFGTSASASASAPQPAALPVLPDELKNVRSSWAMFLGNFDVGQNFLKRIESVKDDHLLASMLSTLAKMEVQIDDLKQLKGLRKRSCKTTNPEVAAHTWRLLASNANTSEKADTILGKGIFLAKMADTLNTNASNPHLPFSAAILLAKVGLTTTHPEQFSKNFGIKLLLDFLARGLAVDPIIQSLGRLVCAHSSNVEPFLTANGPTVFLTALQNEINSPIAATIIQALNAFATNRIRLPYDQFVPLIVGATNGRMNVATFITAVFDLFASLLSRGLVQEEAFAALKKQLVTFYSENLREPDVVASLLRFTVTLKEFSSDRTDLVTNLIDALNGFLKTSMTIAAQVKVNQQSIAVFQKDKKTEDMAEQLEDQNKALHLRINLLNKAVAEQSQVAAELFARLVPIDDSIRQLVATTFGAQEFELKTIFLRNMAVKQLPNIKADLCLAILQASPGHSAAAYAKILEALEMREWKTMPLPILTNLAKDLSTQLAKADTIPQYLSTVVSSIALLEGHPSFLEVLNWTTLVPSIERALKTFVEQTPMPVELVTTLLNGIYPALAHSGTAESIAQLFSPTAIVNLVKAISFNSANNADYALFASSLFFLALICRHPGHAASFLSGSHMVPILIGAKKIRSATVAEAYFAFLTNFTADEKAKTFLLDENALRVAGDFLKDYGSTPATLAAGIRFFAAFSQ